MKFFKQKRIIIFLILILIVGGFFGYKSLFSKGNEASYVTAAVGKSTIIVSVSGSGQVASSDEIDVKPKVSGEVVYIGAKENQEIKAGTLIAQLDTRDAEKSVKDAEIDLAKAKLDLKNAEETKGESLTEACEDGLNVLTNAFNDLSPVIPNLETMFTESSYNGDQNDIDYYMRIVKSYNSAYQLSYWQGGVEDKYLSIKKQFKVLQTDYSGVIQSSPCDQIETVINDAYDIAKTMSEFVRQTYNLVQNYQSLLEEEGIISPIDSDSTDSQFTLLGTYTSSVVGAVNDLSSAKKAITDAKEKLSESDLDIETQNLKVKQCQFALADAQKSLAQHYIYASFDGLVTEVNIEYGDSISASTVLINLVTKQKIAEITLNEIDAAKVELGQKATISFDAIEDLTIVGKVAEIDTVGTVTQGVVTYNIKITLDTQDERIKPGMSVSVVIITEMKQDVLLIPNSAIKTQNNIQYVEVMQEDNTIYSQQIEVGISNDTNTEVVSGLAEGDKVVIQTISNSSSKTSGSIMPSGGGSMEIMKMIR